VTVPDRPRVWRKASRSTNTDNCVEVALDETVGVRDTKDRAGGELAFAAAAWRALTATVKARG
jgi:hypothetical protein